MIKIEHPFDKLILEVVFKHDTMRWFLFMKELQRQPKVHSYLTIVDGICAEMLLDFVKCVEELPKGSFCFGIMDLEYLDTFPSHVS